MLMARFFARPRRNSFDIVLTAFALTPRGRAQIRVTESGFQTRGAVLEICELFSVLMMQREFAQAMAVHHGQLFLDEDPPRDSARFNEVLAEKLDAASAMNADWIIDAEFPLDPDLQSFKDTLEEELRRRLDERIGRNLADGILVRVREPIIHQCIRVGYDPEKVLTLFNDWWSQEDEGMRPDVHPDVLWREFHGRSDERAGVAHVALRFVTLGCSKADIERLLSRQKQIQGQFGITYRTDTLQARVLMDQLR
jgi:hypothetical protein